jgi:hypothetical protein
MYMPVAPANYGGGFGGGFADGWWIILLLLFAGGSFGGGLGGGNAFFPWMMAGQGNTNNDVQRGFDQNAVMTGVSGIQNTLTSGFGDLQTALCGGFAGVNANISNGFAQAEIGDNARQMANMQQMFGISGQLSQCCCDNRLATVQTQNIVQTEGAATRLAIQQQTQAILDKMCQDDIDRKNEKILELQNSLNMANLSASQTAQTATILAALTTTTPAVA